MRITIVQGAFLPVPPLLGGAVEKVWFALGKEFAGRGHSVTHISRCYRGLAEEEVISGVQHLRVRGFDAPASLIYLKWLDLLYSLRVRRRLPEADILVTNTFWLPMLVRNQRLGRLYIHVARYPKGQLRFYSHAARLQTVSRAVADAIQNEVPAFASEVCVIPYPLIQTPEPASPEQESRKKQILYVGRIHPEKGLHLLVSAFAAVAKGALKDWRLVIVGPAETELGGGGLKYLEQIKQLGRAIDGEIDWVGAIFDPALLANYYRRASLFVYPSLAETGETFGLAPLEAMSHGCAPIVSDLACFRDFIADRQDGHVFDHASAQPERQLADRLLELMRDDNARARISEAASRRSQHYNLDRIATAYLEDFAAVLNPRAQPFHPLPARSPWS